MTFDNLTKAEKELLYLAPAMVTILIAGADDDIDDKERATAQKLIRYQEVAPKQAILVPYIKKIRETFEEDLARLLSEYPGMAELRNPIIKEQLEKLNNILPKLNPEFSKAFYVGLRNFAKNIATASGGVLGFFSISEEEKKWLNLDMIKNPTAKK
jgi:hypothetical protein